MHLLRLKRIWADGAPQLKTRSVTPVKGCMRMLQTATTRTTRHAGDETEAATRKNTPTRQATRIRVLGLIGKVAVATIFPTCHPLRGRNASDTSPNAHLGS